MFLIRPLQTPIIRLDNRYGVRPLLWRSLKIRLRQMRSRFVPHSAHYRREVEAVDSGLRLHQSDSIAKIRTSAALRRGVHRLEKGLSMRPRESLFAEDYILETVIEYSALRRSELAELSEMVWAFSVLTEYFSVVGASPLIDRAREIFSNCPPIPLQSGQRPVPFRFDGSRSESVGFQDFLSLCEGRHSVRWFDQRPVPIDLIEKAVTCAATAPSACNRQPFFFRYFDKPVDAVRVASVAMGTGGYAQQIPALIVVLGDWSSIEFERDRHLPYIDGSLAAMNLMLALETLGLASCPINWPDIEERERKMDQLLGLPKHVRPIMLIAVGFPDPEGMVPYSQKKPARSLLRLQNDYLP